MAILFPIGNRWIPKTDDGRFVSYITDIIVYIDDRLLLEWRPVLATGHKPAVSIPLLIHQCLDHYRINPQKLDPRLYRTYLHIVARLTEVVWDIPPTLELIPNNTDRFIRHFTDCVLTTNRMIEEWKLAFERKAYPIMDAGRVMFDFCTERQIQTHLLPPILHDLKHGAHSGLYDARDRKIYKNPYADYRLKAG